MCGGSILSTIGSAAGTFFGGPVGGAIGGALGGLLGSKKSSAAAPAANPAAEQRQAEVDAINKANAGMSMRRKALRDNSLFTGAGEADKTTLGVGG